MGTAIISREGHPDINARAILKDLSTGKLWPIVLPLPEGCRNDILLPVGWSIFWPSPGLMSL